MSAPDKTPTELLEDALHRFFEALRQSRFSYRTSEHDGGLAYSRRVSAQSLIPDGRRGNRHYIATEAVEELVDGQWMPKAVLLAEPVDTIARRLVRNVLDQVFDDVERSSP